MARYQIRESVTVEELIKLLDAAHAELSALCHGKQFRMCIPVDDTDSDIVIGDALRHAEAFVKAWQARHTVATSVCSCGTTAICRIHEPWRQPATSESGRA